MDPPSPLETSELCTERGADKVFLHLMLEECVRDFRMRKSRDSCFFHFLYRAFFYPLFFRGRCSHGAGQSVVDKL